MTDYYMTFDVLVPEWANWVAQDKNGVVYAYHKKPEVSLDAPHIWTCAPGDDHILQICRAKAAPNWREACYEIERK